MAYRFELVSRDGEILGSSQTSEQRWQRGDVVIAHGNQRFKVDFVRFGGRLDGLPCGSSRTPSGCLGSGCEERRRRRAGALRPSGDALRAVASVKFS
jgi:hypothetical protein